MQIRWTLWFIFGSMLTGCAVNNTDGEHPLTISNIVYPTLIGEASHKNQYAAPSDVEAEYHQTQMARNAQIKAIWAYDMRQDRKQSVYCFRRVKTAMTTHTHSTTVAGSNWKYSKGQYTRVILADKSGAFNTPPASEVGSCMNSFADKLAEQKSQFIYLGAPSHVVNYLQSAQEWATTCSVSGRKSALCLSKAQLDALTIAKSKAGAAVHSLESR